MLKYDALQWQLRELSCGSDVLEFSSDEATEKSVVLEALSKRRNRTFKSVKFDGTNDFDLIAKVLRIVKTKELSFSRDFGVWTEEVVDALCDMLKNDNYVEKLCFLDCDMKLGKRYEARWQNENLQCALRESKSLKMLRFWSDTSCVHFLPEEDEDCKFDIDHELRLSEFPFRSDIVSAKLFGRSSIEFSGGFDPAVSHQIADFARAEFLYDDSIAFSGGFDPAVSRLSALEVGAVNQSDLVRLLKSYRKLKELKVFEVSNEVLSELQSYPLEKLALHWIRNDQLDLVCGVIEGNAKLESLEVGWFHEAILRAISRKPLLHTLSFYDCDCDAPLLASCISKLQGLKTLNLLDVFAPRDCLSHLIAALPPQLTSLTAELSFRKDFRFRCSEVISLLKRPNMQKLSLSQFIDYNDDELREMLFILERHESLRQVKLRMDWNKLMEETWSRDVILRISADVLWEMSHAKADFENVYRFLNHRNLCIRARIVRIIETLLALRKFRKTCLNVLQRDVICLIAKCLRATAFDPNAWWVESTDTSAVKKVRLE